MFAAERNELLTRVGAGTPIGELFRRYWLPVLLGEELPEPDCPPVRVKLLGERLIAFRDTQGRLGLIEEFCAHRGVSLWFGRNEENGIRCPYHGWKYDVAGRCVDLPSEPEESGVRKGIRLRSYPAIELAGVIWAYLGPADEKPEEPAYEWTQVPPAHRYVSKRLQESNYLQAMEGALDSIHSGFLHRHSVADDPLLKRDPQSLAMLLADRHPKIVPTVSPAGLYVATRRDVGTDRYYWRVTQWLMPCFSFFPPYWDNPYGGHAFVPIDDERCWTFSIDYHPGRARCRAYRTRHPRSADRRFLHPGREQAQRLSDRPRGAESEKDFFRRARRRRPGCRRAGKHGSDPGPHPGASRLLGQRHRQDAQAADGRCEGGRAQARAAGPRSGRAARPRGGHGRAARVEPARCGCDGAEGPGENGAYGMKSRALHVLLAVASLAVVPRVAALDSRSVLAGLAAYEGTGRHQRLLEGARREGFLSLYTSFPPEDVATLNAAFERKYRVKVRAWRAASEKVLQRTVAEAKAGRDEVDLVDSNSVPLELLRREG